MNYEEKYWELRETRDRAWDKLCAKYSSTNLENYSIARSRFMNFCVEILEKLMDENSDVLARLK